MAQKANDEEKIYSLKTVQTEISRLQKSMDKKREKIESLTAELKEKIAKVWFDEEKMTGEQIEKILELSRRIHDKLDVLDVRDVAEIVTEFCGENEIPTAEKR